MQPLSTLEQLLFSTVRIETSDSSGRPLGSGTAFIFSVQKGERHFLVLVTNKHVVEGAHKGSFFFTRKLEGGPHVGEKCPVEIGDVEGGWFKHPNKEVDVAVMPIAPVINRLVSLGREPFYCDIPTTLAPSAEQIAELDAVEKVLFVGYPTGLFDRKNLLPIVRQGITATPVRYDYNGAPAFLIDASVFPGSSGSPVFLFDTGPYRRRDGGITLGKSRLLFLGLIASVHYRTEEGVVELVPFPAAERAIVTTREMIDLGVVFKAETIVEAVETLWGKVGTG